MHHTTSEKYYLSPKTHLFMGFSRSTFDNELIFLIDNSYHMAPTVLRSANVRSAPGLSAATQPENEPYYDAVSAP